MLLVSAQLAYGVLSGVEDDVGGDVSRAIPSIMQASPTRGMAFGKQLLDQRKAALDQEESRYKVLKARNAAVGSALGAVLSVPAGPDRMAVFRSQAIQLLRQGVITPEELPDPNDEASLYGHFQAALEADKQLENHWKKVSADLAQEKWEHERPKLQAETQTAQQTAAGQQPSARLNAAAVLNMLGGVIERGGDTTVGRPHFQRVAAPGESGYLPAPPSCPRTHPERSR